MRTTIALFALVPFFLTAQYSTPGTGVHWNLDSLVIHSGGVVTPDLSDYLINEDLTISENDSLSVLTYNMYLAPDVLFTIEGYTSIGGFGPIMESINSLQPYEGIRIEESGEAYFDYVQFNGGGGVKCISGDVRFTHCEFMEVQHIATNNGAIEISNGIVDVEECIFQNSLGSAISSAANANCGAEIQGNVFIGNNTENSNRPQINLGASGSNFEIIITGNQILGNPDLDMVGGIATTSLFGDPSEILIANNEIRDNRYGITVSGGNTDSRIFGNIIEDNNTQGLPLLGGSGINLNGPASNEAMIEDNEIRGNLWGITVQDGFSVDLGIEGNKFGSQGLNVFSENGNGGQLYALFNNTPNPIPAQNNCWIEGQESTMEEIEDVVSHENDDDGLGFVDFSLPLCAVVDGLEELESTSISLFPNPTSESIYLISDLDLYDFVYTIYSLDGRYIDHANFLNNQKIDAQLLSQGHYLLELRSDNQVIRTSFIKE